MKRIAKYHAAPGAAFCLIGGGAIYAGTFVSIMLGVILLTIGTGLIIRALA